MAVLIAFLTFPLSYAFPPSSKWSWHPSDQPEDNWYPQSSSSEAPSNAAPSSNGSGSSVHRPQSLGSDLTIVTHNDLYMSSYTDAAIVLSTPMPDSQAHAACAVLGERLWPPDISNGDFLNYITFQGDSGPHWIAGRQGDSCKTFTASGSQGLAQCSELLPALCTQSAPLSNATNADNSTKWQITVAKGQQCITGFRDSSAYEGTGRSNALSFGSECVQPGNIGSEDCLFLNIWTPYLPSTRAPTSKLKPVMFWIHGGGFTGGAGSDPTFDGDSLVSRGGVVVITINYRLRTLGFLALEDGVTNGNFGLADQITALDWVHTHIRDFGGDPNRITLFGQSAGASSVRALLASPRAISKFAAAIAQSNLAGSSYATSYSQYYNISQEVAVAAQPILNATGCLNATSQVSCLRAVSPFLLANLSTVARFLVVDSSYLVTAQLELNGQGPAADVPVLMGFMRDDGAAFISYPSANETVSTLLKSNGFNLSTISSLSVFPEPDSSNKTLNVFNATALVATDSEFRCLDEATAYSAALHDVFPKTYFYESNRSYQLDFYSPNFPVCQPPVTLEFPFGDPEGEYFKCHSGELYYVFGTILFNGLPLRDEFDIPMSQFIVDTWSSFARSYDPNPDIAYLQARGFTNTTTEIQRSGSSWTPVTPDNPTLRLLQYPSVGEPFGIYDGQDQCQAVGFPIDYYESHSS